MISKVTESNKELIKNRIADINKALQAKGSSTVITNLESYYANIIEISQLQTNFHNAPYKYFLMPLDEPVFEIDANKRTVTVPAHFSKNGIGVRGDHMAEVLYFKVDRYFDYQDLYSVDEIIINWQFRPSANSRNAEVKTNTSIALAPDETFDPGHIVFGWVITEDMTPAKGTLSFSVGFIKRIGDSYKYALNTQTTSVAINDSLSIDDPSVLDSLSRPVFERLSDSRFTPESVTPLADPQYKLDLPAVANFGIENGVEDSELVLQVIGKVVDDGVVQYTWNGTTASGDGGAGTIVSREPGATADNDYVLTKDAEPIDGTAYFIKVDGEFKLLPYTYTDENEEPVEVTFAVAKENNIDIYEVGSSFVVTTAGAYQVSMQSVKTIAQTGGNVNVKSGNVPSTACEVPVAAVPLVKLTVEGLSPETGDYEIIDEDIANNFTYIDNTTPTVQATITIDESKIYNIETGNGIRGITSDSSLGAVALLLTDSAVAPTIEEFDSDSFVACDVGDSLPVVADDVNGEGTYVVYAANRRNHTFSISEESNELKVSRIAPKLTGISVDATYNGQTIRFIENNHLVSGAVLQMKNAFGYKCDFAVGVADELDSYENLRVDLQAIEVETDENNKVTAYYDGTENDTPDVYEITEGAFSTTNDPGYFIIRATTVYNGTQRVTETEPFLISSDR